MALATYSDLQAAIANYLARPGDTLVATPADLSFGPIQHRSIRQTTEASEPIPPRQQDGSLLPTARLLERLYRIRNTVQIKCYRHRHSFVGLKFYGERCGNRQLLYPCNRARAESRSAARCRIPCL